MHRILVLFLGLLLSLLASVAGGQVEEIGMTLSKAKDKHKEDVQKVVKSLGEAIEKQLKEAASKGDLEVTKRLIGEKDSFLKKGEFPRSADLLPAVSQYKDERRKASLLVFNAYKEAIASYTKALLVDQATAIKTEMEAFIEEEKRILNGNLPKTDKAGEVSKSKLTHEFIEQTMTKFAEQMEKVASLDTSAKRDEAHRKLGQQLDDGMKTRSITIRFPIKDVEEANGKYSLKFGAPDEIDGIVVSTYMSGIRSVALEAKDALSLKPGDYYVVTGTPRFGMTSLFGESKLWSVITFKSPHTENNYSIFLQNPKSRIEHTKE